MKMPFVSMKILELTVAEGDQLVLCSDGLSKVVSEDEILSEVQSDDRPETVCNELVNLANQRRGEDNITVIVAHLRGKNLFFRFLRILGFIGR